MSASAGAQRAMPADVQHEQGTVIDEPVQSFARAVVGDAYSPNTGVGKYVTYR